MASVDVAGEFTTRGEAMSDGRSSSWRRAVRGGLAAALFFFLAGDRGAQTALIGGIDPLDILKLQVKNNVAVVFDTSGSMKWPVDVDNFSVGGDDPRSRQFQAKKALEAVVASNSARLNFGLLSYNIASVNKTLNQSQNFDQDNGPLGNDDGPFIYVSADTNAAVFYNVFNCDGAGNVDGFFCQIADAFTGYNDPTSSEIFRSFGNRAGAAPFFADPYPAGCTPGVDCFYYLQSRFFRNAQQFTWNTANPSNDTTVLVSGPSAFVCPLPPTGLVGNNPDANLDGFADNPQPCIQFVDNASGNATTFFYTSAIFQLQSGASCGGALTITGVPDSVTDNSQVILDAMQLELPVDNASSLGSGSVTANTVTDWMNGDNPTIFGLRADQSTPIAGSLNFIRTTGTPVFPAAPAAVVGIQKNFVIVLSDGDDTCADSNVDTAAGITAQEAQFLFENTANPRNQAETLVIAFASSINIGRSNKIAQAGSGGLVGAAPGYAVTCPASAECRDAFSASSTDELIRVLNTALDLIVSTGEFSAAPTILSTVFELGPLSDSLPPTDPARVDPMNPDTRYNSRVNVLYQPTFEMPSFRGHLYAFLNDGSFQQVGQANFTGRWDAGETLFEQVSQCLERGVGIVTGVTNRYTFAELHGGFTPRNIDGASPVSGGPASCLGIPVQIKRRIFTSTPANLGPGESPVNRTFTRNAATLTEWDGSPAAQGSNVVALWPPSQIDLDNGLAATAVDPAVGTAGALDDALGIGPGSLTVLTYGQLRGQFGACDGSIDTAGSPAACDDVADPVLALDTARKEARQILLAWLAGAQLARSSNDNKPLRDNTVDTVNKPLIYRDRGWLLGDTLIGAPAIVGPPLRGAPSQHILEFALFRDGRRSAADQQGIDDLDRGFGLRNPDFDDANPDTKPALKPSMTVVYLPANDGLHAFRAGPNCGPAAGQPFNPAVDCGAGGEEGSQELWNFLPFDQLGKVKELFKGQIADPHTYVIGSSVRVADIFLPGPFSLVDAGRTVDYEGRWRTVLFFGRGPGGKFYTALDVTSPGAFTKQALETNPPFVLWNHGNEDPVAGVDPTTDDLYDEMGQSWSVPAVGNVDTALQGLPEWRVWVGSGFGDLPEEGATFYMLDAETGDVLYAKTVGEGVSTFVAENALVASPAGYNAFQLDDPTVMTRSEDRVSRVYIPDVHGRIWKFNTSSGAMGADEGPSQPFGVAVALKKLNDGQGAIPHVFAAAGNDFRVPDDQPFKLFGYSDPTAETDLSALQLQQLFEVTMPPRDPGISEAFRGTVQPATAFNDAGQGRVFFVGTRFNLTTIDCISTFDTILFGLGAISGNAVYDFNNDGTTEMSTIVLGTRATNVQTAGGQVILGDSGGLGRPPSPPPPPSTPLPPAAAQPAEVVTRDMTQGSPVCRVQ